jgi:nucleoside-diphosphate-sugar epimerase
MSKVIFITGASGFLGSHVVAQALEKGYHVKAAARGKKAEALRLLYANNPSIQVVEIADIIHGQFQDELVGVDAVIHTASPLPGRTDPEATMKSAIDGSLNVLRQAEKVGVKKFVLTGSIVSALGDPNMTGAKVTADNWSPVTKDIATTHTGLDTYTASKKFAELAVWEWAEAHPDVDVTTILPTFIYGPFPPQSVPLPKPDFQAISSNFLIFNLLFPTGGHLLSPAYIDFRDVARAHVGALDSKPDKKKRKRIIFVSPHGLTLKHVFDIIKKDHPELERRFVTAPAPEFPYDRMDVDFERIEEVTGMRKQDFYTLEETISDTVNDLLKLEEEWKKNGYTLTEVPPMF